MPDGLGTDLAQAADLSSALAIAADAAEPARTMARTEAVLGVASTGVLLAQTSADELLARLGDRCRALSVGVTAAADHTRRADR